MTSPNVYDYEKKKLTDEPLLKPSEAAAILGIHVKTLNIWARDNKVPVAGVTAGGRRRYRKTDLEAWMKRTLDATA